MVKWWRKVVEKREMRLDVGNCGRNQLESIKILGTSTIEKQ